MFSHVTLGISDFGRALGFWRPVMAALGHAERFADPALWWMHAMVALWLVFALMLFVAETLFIGALAPPEPS